MADDWQVGDLAECVDVRDFGGVRTGGRVLKLGMIYIVRAVIPDDRDGLLLEVHADYGPKLARRFRKVPPLVEDVPEAIAVPRELEAA